MSQVKVPLEHEMRLTALSRIARFRSDNGHLLTTLLRNLMSKNVTLPT